jgi:hypothetical protein
MRRLTSILLVLVLCSFAASIAWSAERPQKVKPVPAASPAAAPAAAPAILSIIPAQAEPGGRVMMFGSGFGAAVSAFLGSVEIPARVIDGKQIEFNVPTQLEPGLYALYLKRSDGVTSRPYNFNILPLRPVLSGLSADQIGSCAQGKEREVIARGRNFSEKTLLLFDGSGLRSNFISSEALSFYVPQVAGGLHQIAVQNSSEGPSVPLALVIETRPEIIQVTVGGEYVSYYELIIDGKNFQPNSSVYVDGVRVGGRGGQEVSEREQLIYADCTKLIYQRHPYSPANKDFRIQVVNPGGEASQVVSVNAP